MAESALRMDEQAKSIWRLGGLRFSELVRRVIKEVDHDGLIDQASALAYNFLFALFPLLLFLVALFGFFAARGTEMRALLFTDLQRVLPPSAGSLILNTMNAVTKGAGGGKMTFGILLGLYSASSGTAAMIAGLNAAYEIHERRSWIKVRGLALALTLGMSVLMAMALGIVLFGGAIAHTGGLGPIALWSWRILQWPAALGFVSTAFALIYYFGPDVEEQHWYWITPGSIVGVLLWLLVSFGLRLYLHFFNSYNRTYGSLGALIILMLWFYVSGLAFLVGGEVNAEIEQAAADRGHPEAKPAGQRAA